MARLRWMLVGAGLVALSSAAYAFQETKGGVSGETQAPAAGVSPSQPPLDLKDTGVSVAPSSGVEVRIPGLGKLGVLPKFDFGLELLYGVGEQKTDGGERQAPLVPDDDVRIRGSLKHRF